MAWFRTKDQSFVEDHPCNLVSNKAKNLRKTSCLFNPPQLQCSQSSLRGSNCLGIGAALWCKEYISNNLLSDSCSTVLLSEDEKTKEDCMSNVVVKMFPNIVLWMVVWCFGRHDDLFRHSGGSNKKCSHAAVINFSSTVRVHHLQEQCSVQVFKAQEINAIRGSVRAA